MAHKRSEFAQKVSIIASRESKGVQVRGLRAKLYNKKRYAEKAQMKKTYAALFPSPNDC